MRKYPKITMLWISQYLDNWIPRRSPYISSILLVHFPSPQEYFLILFRIERILPNNSTLGFLSEAASKNRIQVFSYSLHSSKYASRRSFKGTLEYWSKREEMRICPKGSTKEFIHWYSYWSKRGPWSLNFFLLYSTQKQIDFKVITLEEWRCF